MFRAALQPPMVGMSNDRPQFPPPMPTKPTLHARADGDNEFAGLAAQLSQRAEKLRQDQALAPPGKLLADFRQRPDSARTAEMLATGVLLLVAGLVTIGHDAFLVLSALIGGFLIGGHFGMHSICGIFYPSAYRGNGAGWATSVAKIGSVAGPILGGLILSTSLPVRNIYAVLAVCPAVFAVCIHAVGRRHSRMLGREILPAEAKPEAAEAPQVS